jgi:type IV secretory pathway protease TraF
MLVLAASGVGVAALLAPALMQLPPALLWNATASAPIGLYRVHQSRSFAVGDWVAARAPDSLQTMLAQRRYLPPGVPLVKQIAAVAPQVVCRFGARVTVDQRPAARALIDDRLGRFLPVWRGCRVLQPDAYFLLNPAPASLDGRYFGTTPLRDIVGRLTPLWIHRGASR